MDDARRFLYGHLEAQGIRTVVPDAETCLDVDQIILDELTQGVFTDASQARYVEITNELKARGAHAVALTCTEIELVMPSETAPLPAVDSAGAHVPAIVEWLMTEPPIPA